MVCCGRYRQQAGGWHTFLSGYKVKSINAIQAIITLFKTEVPGLSKLKEQLGIQPHEATECEFYYTYCPPPEKLYMVLDVLKHTKVNHGIRFETVETPKRRKSSQNLVQELVQL